MNKPRKRSRSKGPRLSAAWRAALLLALLSFALPSFAQPPSPPDRPLRFQRKEVWNFSLMGATGNQLALRGFYAAREGIGGFITVWFPDEDFTGRINYNGLITVRQARDVLRYESVGTEKQWTGMSFGITQRLNDALVGQAGVGMMISSRYRHFAPPGATTSTVWVNDDGSRDARVLAEAALSYITGSGMSVTLGLATFPVDLFLGVGFGSRP